MSIHLVPDGLDGDRIDAAAARMTGLSRSRVAELVEAGAVQLDGVVVEKPSLRVRTGAMLEVELDAIPSGVQVTPREVEGVRIVHDDRDLVVVDKPVGVAAHPSVGWEGPSVVEHLAGAGFRISTSGAPERLGIVQPTLSQQLAVLRDEGLVSTRREGKHIHYRIASPQALAVMAVLYQQFCPTPSPTSKE